MPTALHRRILGPYWSAPPPPEAGLFVESIQIHSAARQTLQHQLTACGTWQSGYLFGQVVDEVLQITAAAPMTYPSRDAGSYALGFLDALRATGQATDWIGTWFTAPDDHVPDLAVSLQRFDDGQRTAEFSEQRVLLSFGAQEGRLTFTALRALDMDLVPEVLTVTLAT